jgi:hypothetical protein
MYITGSQNKGDQVGLIITAKLQCDKDGQTQIDIASEDAPIPDGWCKIQGYSNIGNGASAALTGYFCPTCVNTYGTKSLVSTTADLCPDLTAPAQQ